MKRPVLFVIVAVSFVSAAGSASGQSQASTPQIQIETAGTAKSVTTTESDRIRKERQSQARALLISLGSDARSFQDQALRARSLARIADTLWNVDAEQSRTLFRAAWDAAGTADRESKEPLNLRRQVLTAIARRDRLMADEFLQKLKADFETTNKTEDSKPSVWKLPEALQQRLDLAESLLRLGDIESALQFADPVLNTVTIFNVDFLSQLREKDATAADQRYAALLAITGNNGRADANSISILSSYIFTPQTYVAFNTQGGADYSWGPSLPPSNVSPQLKLAFFQTAARVLMRPQPPPDQDQTTTGIVGKYMVVKRLLPIFDLYAPKEIATAMHNQFEALNSLVNEEVRNKQTESLQKGIAPEKSLSDEEQPLRDQIDRAKTSSERDELYFKLALLALNRESLKARDYASEIEDSEFRKRAQGYVDWGLATRAVKKKAVETALDLARKGELNHIQRVWIFTQSAKLLAKTDHATALSLIAEASSEARRIEGSSLDRPRALFGIANAQRLIEPAGMWDTIFDAVKAANSTEGFVGEGATLNLTVPSKGLVQSSREVVPDFDIRGIFSEAGTDDFDRAIGLARGFQGEAPRANATIAICRAVLTEKSSPALKPSAATIKN